jgi:hypothetical protein
MTPNNNLSILPFYDSLEKQNARKSYAYGNIYPLFAPDDKFLPFQIIAPALNNQTIIRVAVYDKNSNVVAEITTEMLQSGMYVKKFPTLGYDLIVYPAFLPLSFKLRQGIYFLVVSYGNINFFSDMFTAVPDVDSYLTVKWWDAEDLYFTGGHIDYTAPYKNTLHVCAQLGKPEYVFEEEGETRDGYFFPEKQISEKTYRFIFLAPEYLCDAMRIIRMSDYVTVESFGQTYNCDTFLITPKWQTQGDLASVECEFQTDTVIKKIGRGVVLTGSEDYNTDFNNDFNS